MCECPLVSVCIITYNSSQFIIETLESIKSQTYQNIELIITDDCSSDSTIELCNEWINSNISHFSGVKLLLSSGNTGVACNVQRGYLACHGEWVKFLAGDDCLCLNAISEFVKFVNKNHCSVCVSDLVLIDSQSNILDDTRLGKIYDNYLINCSSSLDKQKKLISTCLFIPGPPSFFKKKVLDEIGGWSTEYPFADEWPLYYNIISLGYKVFPLDRKLVKYRIHNSLCRGNPNGLINKRVFDSTQLFVNKEIIPSLIKQNRLIIALHLWICYYVQERIYANPNTFTKFLKLLSPYFYFEKINQFMHPQ